jgi:aldehyde dehydrogenase (NAD+)
MTMKKVTRKTARKISAKSGTVKRTARKKKAVTKKTSKLSVKESKKGFKLEYAPAPESTAVATIKKKYHHFINGKFVAPVEGKYMKSINPATTETICEFAIGSKKDVDNAVKAARHAYTNTWSKLSGQERGKYLFRIARILQERAREFAVLETIDGGKPIKESRDVDIPLAAAHFFYNAGWADKLEYAFPGKEVKSIGVCGQIIPWNFPLLMAAWKIAPALATGNTVVLKPAETTPLTALLLAEVFQEAELPDGVVNIVTGAGPTGQFIVEHKDINKIAFTGSTGIGKHIAKTLAHTDKKLTLELGGKSANIVYEDAAMDQAIEGVINGIFFNQGHVCCAGSRLLVEESIAKTFLKKLQKRMGTLRVGDPLDKNTDIGAINSKIQLERIQALVKQGQDEGGEFFRPDISIPKKGYFHAPCYFSDLSNASTVSRIEIFGPVLSVLTFRTPEEAVAKANDTPYGLAAGIWSEKGSKVHKTANSLNAGIIWANTYNKFDPTSPFGGYKESGWGREGGLHGLAPYLEIK